MTVKASSLLPGQHGRSRSVVLQPTGTVHSGVTHSAANFTNQVYGHEKVSVINGGLPRAKKEGVKLETGPPKEFEVSLLPPLPVFEAEGIAKT
jgi:3-mercaptopyruvate sulfurtransferase SseA